MGDRHRRGAPPPRFAAEPLESRAYLSAAGPVPLAGVPVPLPGVIQAENYDLGGEGIAYHDTDPTNLGRVYRRHEAVDLAPTRDIPAGYDVAYTHAGEWLDYTVGVPVGGTYALTVRVASPAAGAAFHVDVDGQNVTSTMRVPDTGSSRRYAMVRAGGIALTAGVHVLKLVIDANASNGLAGNFNWLRLAVTKATGPTPTPTPVPTPTPTPTPTPSPTPTPTPTPTPPPESAKNLLFFGNSFTYTNDMPSLLADVAQAEGHPRPNVYTQAFPTWTLSNHLAKLAADGASNIIRNSLPAGASWDDVVFQDLSTRPLNVTASPADGDPAGFRSDAAALIAQVHAYSPGVTAVPLETWARGANNTVLYPGAYAGPDGMQSDLLANYTLATHDAAATYGASNVSLAKVGEGWRALNWARDLYNGPDEYHPSAKGSMLEALITYRSIYHQSVEAMPAATLSGFLAAHGLSMADWSQIATAADGV